MSRGRGRPAERESDIALVWSVRNAKDRGANVEAACRAFLMSGRGDRFLRMRTEDPLAACVRRYHRMVSQYPDAQVGSNLAACFGGQPRRRISLDQALQVVLRK